MINDERTCDERFFEEALKEGYKLISGEKRMKLKLTEEQRKQVLSAYENKELIELEVFEPKPKQKVIDLSMMVGSDIDMEFSAGSETSWGVGLLGKIGKAFNSTVYFGMANFNGHHWIDSSWSSQCRIRQDHWHHWNGGECPLPEGLEVKVICRSGKSSDITGDYTQRKETWIHKNDGRDIIAFKVLGTADDACYEWQKEKEE